MKALIAIAFALVLGACSAPRATSPYAPPNEADRNSLEAQDLTQKAAAIIDSDPQKAEALLRKALTADLFHGPAHNDLGVIYLKQNKLYAAANEFEWARKLMPGHPDPRMNLALTLERAGRIDEALATYDTALEVYPNHLPTLEALTRLQLRHGRTDERTPKMLREIALRGETEEWRAWRGGGWRRSRQVSSQELLPPRHHHTARQILPHACFGALRRQLRELGADPRHLPIGQGQVAYGLARLDRRMGGHAQDDRVRRRDDDGSGVAEDALVGGERLAARPPGRRARRGSAAGRRARPGSSTSCRRSSGQAGGIASPATMPRWISRLRTPRRPISSTIGSTLPISPASSMIVGQPASHAARRSEPSGPRLLTTSSQPNAFASDREPRRRRSPRTFGKLVRVADAECRSRPKSQCPTTSLMTSVGQPAGEAAAGAAGEDAVAGRAGRAGSAAASRSRRRSPPERSTSAPALQAQGLLVRIALRG